MTIMSNRKSAYIRSGLLPLVSVFVCAGIVVSGQTLRQVSELRFSIEEEVPSGTEVGQVAFASEFNTAYSDDVLTKLRFQFLNQPTVDLTIEEHFGVIRTRGRIDRESLCASMTVCEIRLDVAVQPMPFFRIVKVVIEVLDINDNSPEFRLRSDRYELIESALPGWGVTIPAAIDSDIGQFSVDKYRLVTAPHNHDFFELKVDLKMDGSNELRLVR